MVGICALAAYAVWCVVKHTPDAAVKESTLKSAEALQRVVLWSLAAVLLIALISQNGGL